MITDITLYMHVYRHWSDLFNWNLSVWPWHWLFSVQCHLILFVYLCVWVCTHLSLLSFILMITDIILCMFKDLDQISSIATFLCDHDLDFFSSRSLNHFDKALLLSLLSFIWMITYIIFCMLLDIDQMSSTATFLCDPELDVCCSRSLNIFTVFYMKVNLCV